MLAARQVLECAGPLALWACRRIKGKRRRTAAVQKTLSHRGASELRDGSPMFQRQRNSGASNADGKRQVTWSI